MTSLAAGRVRALVFLSIVFGLSPVSNVFAEATTKLGECQAIREKSERLECYDALPAKPEAKAVIPAEDPTKTALEKRLAEEKDLTRRAFILQPHRPSYILHTYSSTPNVEPFLAVDSNAYFQKQELKFQLSLRVPVWNKVFGNNGDLWFGYTQQSFWQAYNWNRSAPFRETNYEPEFGLTFHTDFSFLGIKHRLLSVGFAHQSNGRTEPLSRSWNRIWATFVVERGDLVVSLKPWYRISEEKAADNNPEIEDYVGRGELHIAYKFSDQVFSLQVRNNLLMDDNRSGYEANWTWPFSKRIKGLVQYFNGYGESLIDYDVRMRRIGLGILISDWL